MRALAVGRTHTGGHPGLFQENKIPGRILPRRLEKGMRIGLVTPGSPVTEQQLAGRWNGSEALGFRTVYRDSVLAECGYLAGRDRDRAAELMVCSWIRTSTPSGACGGAMDRSVSWTTWTLRPSAPIPKALGYSDIPALLNAIFQETGLVCSGPSGSPISTILPSARQDMFSWIPSPTTTTLTTGGRGQPVRSGIRSLHPAIGTGHRGAGREQPSRSWSPSSGAGSGRISAPAGVLEEVEEKTYRVDRMLYHLLSGTNLPQAAGIVLGAVAAGYNVATNPPAESRPGRFAPAPGHPGLLASPLVTSTGKVTLPRGHPGPFRRRGQRASATRTRRAVDTVLSILPPSWPSSWPSH
ncbi:MAG: hypothetical protein R2751_19655 [Bacteroidales bacterium]